MFVARNIRSAQRYCIFFLVRCDASSEACHHVSEKSLRADEEKQEKEKRMQLEAEEEIKKMRKQMIPHARRMPFFDLPFKPHRSTKSLTVPRSTKFQTLKSKKTIAPSTIQE
ncbi:hypothetical protein R1flu_024983 [Riccia fluitans]|uniref:TPX2 C-terminal domain-containing protein n=1 Tax=Riccia fluitans TaxID=41844 RepID=A0ABD1XZG1_9MARC